jgi:hypothetical protein
LSPWFIVVQSSPWSSPESSPWSSPESRLQSSDLQVEFSSHQKPWKKVILRLVLSSLCWLNHTVLSSFIRPSGYHPVPVRALEVISPNNSTFCHHSLVPLEVISPVCHHSLVPLEAISPNSTVCHHNLGVITNSIFCHHSLVPLAPSRSCR